MILELSLMSCCISLFTFQNVNKPLSLIEPHPHSSEDFGLEIHEKTDAKKGQEQQLDPDCKRKKMTTLKTNNYLTEF